MTVSNAVRSSGILLHPISLPGAYGIGDLGPAAFAWVDRLAQAKQTWWQILPLGPTGYGDSPYSSFSAFAGNPLLISPDRLVEDGLLPPGELESMCLPEGRIDYGAVIQNRLRMFGEVWQRFQGGAASRLKPEFEQFCTAQRLWLDDFALFAAIKVSRGGQGWQDWPTVLRRRELDALNAARRELADSIQRSKFVQFLFYRQWHAVKKHANDRKVRLIGDIPIFVAPDSVDVWANPELFLLDADRRPLVVAGVPPDYFCPTGQLWGNPHYNWERLRETHYAWWLARIRACLAQTDLVRLDHFIGFEKAYHVPFGRPTAEEGHFVPGPGSHFFESLQQQLGGLPFIAEDLGLVTPEVEAIRDGFHLPGMLILQFAFGGATENRFLPHNYERNGVVYTGTHDNDTTWGWFNGITDAERDLVRRYVARDGTDVVWDLIRLAWSSTANYAITTLQDVLEQGSEARMNFPGRGDGNWCWRFQAAQLTDEILGRLRDLTVLYSRDTPTFTT